MLPISVIILTHNEEPHIARAIASVRPIAREIFVIDSFSTDGTVAIAKAHGATVLQNTFINYATQFSWAMNNIPRASEWIMRLDADEIIEPALCDELRQKLPVLPADVAGVNFKRKLYFMGRWIRFGGRYPLILTRLWRTGCGRIEQRWMDEHIIIEKGGTVTMDAPFSDRNLKDLTFFIDKHNKYATREAIDTINARHRLFTADSRQLLKSSHSPQAYFRRLVKEGLYNAIPFYVSSFAYFLYRYIILLGFLDGREGLIYHFLQGYWYRFLAGAKVCELEEALLPLTSKEEKIRMLKTLTHMDIPCQDNAPPAEPKQEKTEKNTLADRLAAPPS